MAKRRTKPKGYFLGGVAKGLFGGQQKSSVSLPGYVKKLQDPFVNLVRGELDRPDAATVAPFSADSQSAFGQVRDLATGDPTGYGNAMSFAKNAITSGFDANEPWNERLVQSTLQDFDRSTDMDRARAARSQAGRGAFGDRAFIDDRERDRTATNDRAMLGSRLMEDGIQRRQQAAGALAGLAGDERASAFQGAQMLDLSGQRQEGRDQQVLDAPFRRIQAVAPIFGSAPSATNTQTQESPFKTVAGVGLAAAGLFRNGGRIDRRYQDGGAISSGARALQQELARALRQGDTERAASIRARLAQRTTLDRTPISNRASDDPRLGEAERRRQGPPALDPMERLQQQRDELTAQDTPESLAAPSWLTDNPIVRGAQDAMDVLSGREPMWPGLGEARPEEAGDEAAGEGAFSPAPPTPRPDMHTVPNAPRPGRTQPPAPPPQFGRPAARPEMQGPPAPPENQGQAVEIGADVAMALSEEVPEAERGAFAKWVENPLTLIGLGMLASNNPSLFGAFGEGALSAMDIMDKRDGQAFEQERRTAADAREEQEADRRRRRDAVSDDQWDKTFGATRDNRRDTFELARQRLDEETRVNNARIENFLRPRTEPRDRADPYLNALYQQLARARADPVGDEDVVERLLMAIAQREAPAGGGMPALPPGFEMAEP